jgi:hypothetical protein
MPANFVAADLSTGTATITWTPQTAGFKRLFVVSVDRAGNQSPQTIYQFRVANPPA